MAGKLQDRQQIVHAVRLVAISGREQPIHLCIRQDGLWLFTEGGKV
jgi:hypothetical protein